ncbi:MAG: Plug domain-containing protein [Gemmatimonadota bacterium]
MAVLVTLSLLASGSWASAQVPDSARTDTVKKDSTDVSGLFLKTQEESRIRTDVLPLLGADRLLPALSRFVFDRDSLEWMTAETVSDILTKVPGVYLWRGGWLGQTEMPNFQGRMGAGTQFFLDGVPYLPLGVDSLAVDPSLFALSFLERIEIERLPGQLRVYLYTKRHDRLVPRSRVGIASGDQQVARYQASLEARRKSGVGFVAAAEHLAVPQQTALGGSYSNTQVWAQLSYVKPHFGAEFQLFHQGPRRDPQTSKIDGVTKLLTEGFNGSRQDLQARLYYSAQRAGIGPRVDLVWSRSAWTPKLDTLIAGDSQTHVTYGDQAISQIAAIASYRLPRASVQLTALNRSRWTPYEVRAAIGASPNALLTASAEAQYQSHDGGRTSQLVTGQAGLALPFRFRVTGIWRQGSVVDYPQLPTGPARNISDRGVVGGFDHPRFAAEVGYWKTDGFAPEHFAQFPFIDSITPLAPTQWVTFSGRIAPRQWLILDGWYSNPIGASPDGAPRTHSLTNLTIQSKFLRTFRSGIFGLKVQFSMETWGPGFLGYDKAAQQPVRIPGATFFRGYLQLKIADFVAYYDRANFQATRLTYVPGLPIRDFISTFGVRWEFTN